jgi:sugar phosphate isomerase/epimerase
VQRLGNAIAAAGLEVAGVSIVDVDLFQEARLEQSRAKVIRALEVSKTLGATFLSIGFHALPTEGEMPGQWSPSADDEPERIGSELAQLAEIAQRHHVQLSLETFERGILDRSANVLAIIAAAGNGLVGANPDLANLLRAPWPLVEEWDETFRRLAPHVNYWHVKNGMRISLPDGSALYQPTNMQNGNIDYRSAIQTAVRSGFRGPLAIEHYGGDAVAHAESGRVYLEEVIEDVCAYEGIDIKEICTK